MHYIVGILDSMSLGGGISIAQFKLIIRLRKIVYSRLCSYETSNLIIIHCYIYSGLPDTMENII